MVQRGDPIGRVESVEAGNGSAQVDMNVGATVVDLEFNVPGVAPSTNTTRLLYMSDGDGAIRQRTVEADREDPKRLSLRAQMSLGGVASAGP